MAALRQTNHQPIIKALNTLEPHSLPFSTYGSADVLFILEETQKLFVARADLPTHSDEEGTLEALISVGSRLIAAQHFIGRIRGNEGVPLAPLTYNLASLSIDTRVSSLDTPSRSVHHLACYVYTDNIGQYLAMASASLLNQLPTNRETNRENWKIPVIESGITPSQVGAFFDVFSQHPQKAVHSAFAVTPNRGAIHRVGNGHSAIVQGS